MKVVILSKSDGRGGAAIVSYRLMEALREQGVDARMLVAEKLTDSPYVSLAGSPLSRKWKFLTERLSIFVKNGFDRSTLFKIDTGQSGLPLWRHPLVRQADAVLVGWVNQAFLSLDGVARIAAMGKKIIWTMHDMWNFTGICHHAGTCRHFTQCCGDCPLLRKRASSSDLSRKVWKRKELLYGRYPIDFVAVSSWLENLSRESGLLGTKNVSLIPNPFPIPVSFIRSERPDDEKRIVFGAARIDDPIKGFPIFCEALKVFSARYPELVRKTSVVLYGGIHDPSLLDNLALKSEYLGEIHGMQALREVYDNADVVVSTSHYENLPGTLVEGQAFGCVPVAFDRGGQRDIISHLQTGYLVEWSDNPAVRAEAVAEGIAWALEHSADLINKMSDSVNSKFSYSAVASRYLALIRQK